MTNAFDGMRDAADELEGDTDPTRVLVVEDEKHLAAGLKLNLEIEGFSVDVAGDAREAAALLLRTDSYGAIILDVMLPDLDGFELCSRIRSSGNYTPLIMLTARGDPADRVRGLEAGADDYMVKPFDLQELMARVRSALRRRVWEKDETKEEASVDLVVFGRAKVDLSTYKAHLGEEIIDLTRLEVDLIRYFAANPDRTLSRNELLEHVWQLRGYHHTRTVDNFMARLRRYFEPDPSSPVHFIAVRGVGYRFVPDPS